MALVEVLLPDSATPMKPRIGATTMKYGPSAENALASDPAVPQKFKTIGQAEDEDADQAGAPHLRPGFLEDFGELRAA